MTPRDHLAAAKKALEEELAEIASRLEQAAKLAEVATVAFEAGRHDEARAALELGCDLEYEALCDCEALGRLSETLYPSEGS